MDFVATSRGIIKGFNRGILLGIGAMIFLDVIGVSITPLLASLGVGSLAVALALQDTLSNFFSGIYTMVDKPVRVGDFIKLETGEEGYVTDVGWRNTRIRMLPNDTVVIPNGKLVGDGLPITYLPEPALAVLVQVGVHYDSDLKHVERVTCEVAKKIMQTVPGGVPNPAGRSIYILSPSTASSNLPKKSGMAEMTRLQLGMRGIPKGSSKVCSPAILTPSANASMANASPCLSK